MLHELPITNVRLNPCHEDWHQMTPTEQGRHCAVCDREVVDFTQASVAELVQAQAAAPDGRVCGRFRPTQLVPSSRPSWSLRPRLRQFLVAAVLILMQGLSAHQAWAQTKRPVHKPQPKKAQPTIVTELLGDVEELPGRAAAVDTFAGRPVYAYAEQMPMYPGGVAQLQTFMLRQLRYPPQYARTTIEGSVFVEFIVDRNGQVQRPTLVKGIAEHCDAEALRVVRLLPRFAPGHHNGQPVDVRYALALRFDWKGWSFGPRPSGR